MKILEASAGIEPAYTDLQSAASPLRQLASVGSLPVDVVASVYFGTPMSARGVRLLGNFRCRRCLGNDDGQLRRVPQELPADPGQAIATYFEASPDEWFDLQQQQVSG